MASVKLSGIRKIYEDGARTQPAVHDLDLEIADVEFMVLVGPSGCGKSTTLRMIAGLEAISAGDLSIGGRRVNELPAGDRCENGARKSALNARRHRHPRFRPPSRGFGAWFEERQRYSRPMRSRRSFVPISQWGDKRQRRGLAGERAAIAYLTSCGWNVEAHRFRMGRHDLDLVARRGHLVAFVEVKTRRSSACGDALESVSALKRHILGRVAMLWRLRHGRLGDTYRFDVLAIRDLGGGKYEVDHVEDAWRMGWSPC